MQAWVIFTDETDLKWLRILKRGFRHCFLLLHDGVRWIALDPLASNIEISVPDTPSAFDLPRWFQAQGYLVQRAGIVNEARPMPLAFFSCVEVIKRTLGIRSRRIITPYQLYKYIITQQKKGKEKWEA